MKNEPTNFASLPPFPSLERRATPKEQIRRDGGRRIERRKKAVCADSDRFPRSYAHHHFLIELAERREYKKIRFLSTRPSTSKKNARDVESKSEFPGLSINLRSRRRKPPRSRRADSAPAASTIEPDEFPTLTRLRGPRQDLEFQMELGKVAVSRASAAVVLSVKVVGSFLGDKLNLGSPNVFRQFSVVFPIAHRVGDQNIGGSYDRGPVELLIPRSRTGASPQLTNRVKVTDELKVALEGGFGSQKRQRGGGAAVRARRAVNNIDDAVAEDVTAMHNGRHALNIQDPPTPRHLFFSVVERRLRGGREVET
ncbi:hypothetical protein GWI33_016929 [Rhynchophorus ferrugineus]|uniref:Uncharacterized protein n=1 Tax=Rhynchophorus ferrugineus TaxID=354439 RepID=A0A834M2V8_RHYFE|nr:hypothetical protein GWI33_016929 [Rhynchophorus ferrugineus]